ncbi:MAG: diguanylate cyclase [Alphaproteobacteria bacterium]
MAQVLVVGENRFLRNVIRRGIENGIGLGVVCADSLAEAQRVVDARPDAFFLALAEYALPDAPDGESLQFLVDKGIPAVAFAGAFSEDFTRRVFARNVIDYVITDNPACLDYLLTVVARLNGNRRLKVLMVDDSSTARHFCVALLRQYQFTVLEAADGQEALAVIEANHDLSLVITDYTMPHMDGFELVKQIRRRYARHELPVIGISAQGDSVLSARFIKNGANDFLTKPFSREEFFCRISQNIEFIEQVRALKDSAHRDYLTGLYNRRYFIARGGEMFAADEPRLAVAMVDVDFFKKVNDTYGHDTGDVVLKQVALALANHFSRESLVARFGGEEFCVILPGLADDEAVNQFDRLRATIAARTIVVGDTAIQVTVSIGVCTARGRSLEDMIGKADTMLYMAKKEGRNRVISHD